MTTKPLGHKSYGSIGHLPGSRMDHNHKKYGTGKKIGQDFGIHPGAARICLENPRDKHDRIIVQEKLDGTNVAVANIDGQIVPLIRAGYPAVSARYEQHHLFAAWVFSHLDSFSWLIPGERVCGEWLAQAHGTRYNLAGRSPFVAFDIMCGHDRSLHADAKERLNAAAIPMPATLWEGPPCSVEQAMEILGERGHYGANEMAEGAVWRVEREGSVDFLAKYVRPEKVDGKYLPEVSGQAAIWNWRPS